MYWQQFLKTRKSIVSDTHLTSLIFMFLSPYIVVSEFRITILIGAFGLRVRNTDVLLYVNGSIFGIFNSGISAHNNTTNNNEKAMK